jgi:hypothetical protein
MILLNESSSNTFVIQPTASFADGSSFVYRFTDVFSQEQFLGIATGSKYGNWVKLPITVSTSSYTIGFNTSTLPLRGGTYEIKVFSAPDVSIQWDTNEEDWNIETTAWNESGFIVSIYGTEPRKWGLMGNTWSSVLGIPTINGNGIWTSRAWVSESIGRKNYTSTNEIAAYVVYNG